MDVAKRILFEISVVLAMVISMPIILLQSYYYVTIEAVRLGPKQIWLNIRNIFYGTEDS